MSAFLLNHLASTSKIRRVLRMALRLSSIALLFTRVLPGQGSKAGSKIPEGEAQFTPQQLEQYHLVYHNPDVRYLRTLFDRYLRGSGVKKEERQMLEKWDKAYFRSKFTVVSRDGNRFGGTFITILFEDRPDKVFVAWIYPEGSHRRLTLRRFEPGDFSAEDIKRMRLRYKRLLEDKAHAL